MTTFYPDSVQFIVGEVTQCRPVANIPPGVFLSPVNFAICFIGFLFLLAIIITIVTMQEDPTSEDNKKEIN